VTVVEGVRAGVEETGVRQDRNLSFAGLRRVIGMMPGSCRRGGTDQTGSDLSSERLLGTTYSYGGDF
jgi:hypothetical protein